MHNLSNPCKNKGFTFWRFVQLLFIVGVWIMATSVNAASLKENDKKAIFAGGCFWCTEAAFDFVDGVKETVSGYTGGELENPTYEQVSSGKTKHREALLVIYDATKVDYQKLLEIYWENIDPFDEGGQFFDRGEHYKTAIFYVDEEQKQLAESSKLEIEERLGKSVAPDILPASEFYAAETYHQNYHQKNPLRYNLYKKGSGRTRKLQKIWGK